MAIPFKWFLWLDSVTLAVTPCRDGAMELRLTHGLHQAPPCSEAVVTITNRPCFVLHGYVKLNEDRN